MDGNIPMISMGHGKIKEACLILLGDASGSGMPKSSLLKARKLIWQIKTKKFNDLKILINRRFF